VSLKVRTENGTVILTPRGMLLSGQDTEELEQKIIELDAGGNQRLLIDLSETTYLSSTGLGVLLLARAKYVKRNAEVKICSVGEKIRQIFDLVKMPVVFGQDLHETEEDALASFRPAARRPGP
jgi:anti-sigma B factor antagonist